MPRPWASLMVSPSNDQDVPAFRLFVITLPITMSDCMLSSVDCERKLMKRRHSKLQQTTNNQYINRLDLRSELTVHLRS